MQSPAPARLSPHAIALMAVVGIFLLCGALSIGYYPPLNYNLGDEIWAMHKATESHGLKRSGSLVEPRLYIETLRAVMAATGRSVEAARALSLICGAAAIGLTYLLGRLLVGRGVGLMSALLLATSFAFNWHSRIVRAEAMSMAMVLLGVVLLVAAVRKDKPLPAFLGAFACAASVGVHPNNLQFALAAFLLFLAIGWRGTSWPTRGGFIGGYAFSFLAWMLVVLKPALGKAGLWDKAWLSMKSIVGIFPVTSDPMLLVRSLWDLPVDLFKYIKGFDAYFPTHIATALPAMGIALFAIAALVGRHRKQALVVLGFSLGATYISYLVAKSYGYWHMIELYPFFALAAAMGIVGAAERLKPHLGALLVAGAVVFFLACGIADTALAMRQFRPYDYGRFIGKVRAMVPPGARVLSHDLYSPALAQGAYVRPWFQMDRPMEGCVPFEQALRASGATHIIGDGLLLGLTRQACGAAYEKEAIRFINLQCTPVGMADARYPNFWAPDAMVRQPVLYKIK